MKTPKKGDKIYITSACYISRGSADRIGGLATISEVEKNGINIMVSFEKFPGLSMNYEYLMKQQEELKKQFGDKEAYPDPDIDTPWIEDGDTVNGKIYHGHHIW